MKAWVLTKVSSSIHVEVGLYEDERDALYQAEQFIREETGGPEAWKQDEWHEMREAMRDHDVRKQIKLFNDSFSEWTDGFVQVEEQEVKAG